MCSLFIIPSDIFFLSAFLIVPLFLGLISSLRQERQSQKRDVEYSRDERIAPLCHYCGKAMLLSDML